MVALKKGKVPSLRFISTTLEGRRDLHQHCMLFIPLELRDDFSDHQFSKWITSFPKKGNGQLASLVNPRKKYETSGSRLVKMEEKPSPPDKPHQRYSQKRHPPLRMDTILHHLGWMKLDLNTAISHQSQPVPGAGFVHLKSQLVCFEFA